MTATTISFGLRKGGVSKTTTAAITSYLLAKEARVLAVDLDSQGNLSEMLLQQDIELFEDHTVYEACRDQDARPYIFASAYERLHVLPADSMLALFHELLPDTDKHLIVKKMLQTVIEDYDYIIIDTPPHLGAEATNGIAASDYLVIPMMADGMSYRTLSRYLEWVHSLFDYTELPVKIAGILITMLDPNTVMDTTVVDKVRERHGHLLFESKIKKRVRIKEFFSEGIQEHTQRDREALEPYAAFTKELLGVVRKAKQPTFA